MKRQYRELNGSTKQKISASMKKHYHQLTDAEKQEINQKKSESLKRYWQKVPSRPANIPDDGKATIYDIML